MKKLGSMSFGKKIEYIFDYYKFHIIGVVVALVLIFSVVGTLLNNKPLGFYAMLLNAQGSGFSTEEKVLEARFADMAGIDGSEKVVIDTTATYNPNVNSQFNMAENAKITALFASHDLDALVIDPGVFTYYALNGAFTDLREVLSEDEFGKYESENRIYYIDGAIREKMKSLDAADIDATSLSAEESGIQEKTVSGQADNASKEAEVNQDSDNISGGNSVNENTESKNSKNSDDESTTDVESLNQNAAETLDEMEQFAADLMGTPDVVAREDFMLPDPEKMEKPIPVGIIVTDVKLLSENGYFERTVPVFGVPVVSDRKELAVKFLQFLEEC
ncbi:hypothetical protein SAMN05216356_1011 [Oribacterium sp. WCC10]|nr:hypothetical protein SAMN05216356_1011 [Oribacterium sp. WCC10]